METTGFVPARLNVSYLASDKVVTETFTLFGVSAFDVDAVKTFMQNTVTAILGENSRWISDSSLTGGYYVNQDGNVYGVKA